MYERPANRLAVHKAYTLGPDVEELKEAEGRNVYDTIILADSIDPLRELEDQEITLAIRLLTPEDRRMKYCTRVMQCRVSSDPAKYSGRLHILYQRGLWHPKSWSIEVIREQPGLLVAEASATGPRS